MFSSEEDPGLFAHTSHLPEEVPTFSSSWEGEAKMCLDFSVTSNCCQTTHTKSRFNSMNSFMKAAGQPINAAKERKVKLKPLLKLGLLPSFVHVP